MKCHCHKTKTKRPCLRLTGKRTCCWCQDARYAAQRRDPTVSLSTGLIEPSSYRMMTPVDLDYCSICRTTQTHPTVFRARLNYRRELDFNDIPLHY